jgi:hypothetical protein
MRRPILLLLTLVLVLACQIIPTPPALRATPFPLLAPTRPRVSPVAGSAPPQTAATQTGAGSQTPVPGELALFPYDVSHDASLPFADIQSLGWSPESLSGANQVGLPFPMEKVANLAVAAGLTSRQRVTLSQNGFVVLHSQEAQFSVLRQRVSLRNGQPYYLTIDAASHALRMSLAGLLPALERDELRRRLLAVTQATLNQLLAYLPLVQGTDLEADTRLSAAYLAVAVRLLDPQAALNPELDALVQPQVEQVLSANRVETSRLLPGFQDDYRLYRPTGHYAVDPDLQAYFRAMTWLERVRFSYQETPSGSQPSRLPLLVTLALRQATIESTPAAQEWARIYETINFLNGPSAGANPAQYAAWMDQIYGRSLTIFGLSDVSRWAMFLAYARDLPAVQSNPAFAMLPADPRLEQSWTFLGSRFNLDDSILQSLAAARADISTDQRLQPGGLEVMAVLGSQTARQAIQYQGETAYRTKPDEITRLQKLVQQQSEAQWSGTLHGAWLHAVQASMAEKSQIEPPLYPAYMRTSAWSYKDLNSALGSWVEIYHDSRITPLPSAAQTASDLPASPAAPGYVEPDPLAFYRLSNLAYLITEGLKQRQLTGVFTSNPAPTGLSSLQQELSDLADRLQRLGNIAAKELAGASLQAGDYAVIQAPLGPLESYAALDANAAASKPVSPEPALPAIVSFDSIRGRVVQAGIGPVDRILVLVSLDGVVYIAQGGVYSFYEFSLPQESRLEDATWRWMLINDPPKPPAWVESFYLPEGYPVDVLAFRSGDIFRVTLAAEQVTIYAAPRLDAAVISRLHPGDLIKIIAGPVLAEKASFWKVQVNPTQPGSLEGWMVESQTSFERLWGQ